MADGLERELVGPIESNRFEAFASLGHSPYSDVQEDAEMLRIFTNIAVLHASPMAVKMYRSLWF